MPTKFCPKCKSSLNKIAGKWNEYLCLECGRGYSDMSNYEELQDLEFGGELNSEGEINAD